MMTNKIYTESIVQIVMKHRFKTQTRDFFSITVCFSVGLDLNSPLKALLAQTKPITLRAAAI